MSDETDDPVLEERITVRLNRDLAERLTVLRERVEDLKDQLAVARATAEEPQWIVNDLGELGVIVGGRAYFLYKGESLEYAQHGDCTHNDDGTPRLYRPVGKREFGETCEPTEIVRTRCKPELSPDDIAFLRGRYLLSDGWRELADLGTTSNDQE